MSDADPKDHKEKMQQRQAEQRAKVAELQDPDKGLVLVHTGPGKGKSSSAFGVVVRALVFRLRGWSPRVVIRRGRWVFCVACVSAVVSRTAQGKKARCSSPRAHCQ